jgi:hypothetical protein
MIHNKLQGQRAFPVGSRVKLTGDYSGYKDMKRDWDKYETRGYMEVVGHSSDGWLRFDNINYTRMGGSWNPVRYVIIPEIKINLPEELFTI